VNKIEIFINDLKFEGELNHTKVAQEIYNALPIEAEASFWGEEIYFGIPIKIIKEDLTEEVLIGDLGYWPDGNGFCIFYGKTPASIKDEPKPVSPVTIIGKIRGSVEELKKLKQAKVRVIKN
jgi:uncharacterized protein